MCSYCPNCDTKYPESLKSGDKCPYCSWVSAGCDTCGRLGMYCEGETCSSCYMMPYKIKLECRFTNKCDCCNAKMANTLVDAGYYNFCGDCVDRLTEKGIVIVKGDEPVEEGTDDDLYEILLAQAEQGK